MTPAYQGFYVNIILCVGLTLLLSSLSNRDNRVRFFLCTLALFFNFRYLAWRVEATLPPFHPDLATLWQYHFFLVEFAAVGLLSWHLVLLTVRPRNAMARDVADLPGPPPAVDVLIPTFNEPRKMLRATIRAAKRIQHEPLTVWILDDGARDWLKELCAKEEINYVRREDRKGYKAGNLNHALALCKGDYLLCLDADFVVHPNILKKTLGYFRDQKIGIVQTPQHFENPDAIQYNLGGAHAWPEDQCVFTDMIQPCRDTWDNAFCYGTNFVVRRHCLDAVGGFPENTICEDIFLTYLLKQHGWITRYHNERLAIGQAAMTLNEFIKQRMRWCCGTIQCLFLKGGPIFSRKLSLRDRIFYLDPAIFYFISMWPLLLTLSPAIYWWTGTPPFYSSQGHLMMMFFPRMWISVLSLYWLTDRKVVPVVSEIGRHLSMYYMVGTILRTVGSPFSKVFRVTLKNVSRKATTINWTVLGPHLALALVTVAGIVYAFWSGDHSRILWDENLGLVLALTVYMFWMSYFVVLACVEPALEKERAHPRADLVRQGSISGSLLALSRKVMQ